jgi:hypothetical protein
MARVDPQSVYVLESLPSPHRRFLFEANADRLRGSSTVREKCERLAVIIGPRDIMRYVNLYLPHNGSSFAWYKFPHERTSIHNIYNELTREHRGIEAGLEPRLEEDGPPRLHRLVSIREYLILEYVALDGVRNVVQRFRPRTIHVDSMYRIVLRNQPFTTEVRAPSPAKRLRLLEVLGTDIGRNLTVGIACAPTTTAGVDGLKRAMNARFEDAVFRSTGQGLSRTQFSADDVTELDATAPYQAEIGRTDRHESSRAFEFRHAHPDGYIERAYYHVTLSNGSMRVGRGISELAIEALRQNVIRL